MFSVTVKVYFVIINAKINVGADIYACSTRSAISSNSGDHNTCFGSGNLPLVAVHLHTLSSMMILIITEFV